MVEFYTAAFSGFKLFGTLADFGLLMVWAWSASYSKQQAPAEQQGTAVP